MNALGFAIYKSRNFQRRIALDNDSYTISISTRVEIFKGV